MIIEAGKVRLERSKPYVKDSSKITKAASKFMEWAKLEYSCFNKVGFQNTHGLDEALMRAILEWNNTASNNFRLSIKDIDDIERTML